MYKKLGGGIGGKKNLQGRSEERKLGPLDILDI
jgi:hypothetical protein